MSSHIISIVRRLEYGYMVYKPFLANRKLEGFYCSMTPQVTGQPSMFPRTSSWNALNKPMTTANRHQSPTLLHKQLNTPGITLPRNKRLHQKHKHEIQNGSGMVRSIHVHFFISGLSRAMSCSNQSEWSTGSVPTWASLYRSDSIWLNSSSVAMHCHAFFRDSSRTSHWITIL